VTAITFDTLKFVERLKDSGIPEAQAKAIAEAVREAQGEAELATVRDLRELGELLKHEIELVRRDLKELEQRMTIKLGAMLVVAVSIVAALVKLL
jgi:DNA-binding transcriptional MerR regulator